MKKVLLSFVVLLLTISNLFAQLTQVTDGLNRPLGVTIDHLGKIWVTENGTGHDDGSVTVVSLNGTKIPMITGLPSYVRDSIGNLSGAYRTVIFPNSQIAVVVGSGPTNSSGRILFFDFNNYNFGTDAPKTLKDTTKSIDITIDRAKYNASNGYSFVTDSSGNTFVAMAAANNIIKITPDGKQSVFVAFPPVSNPTPVGPPMIDFVPTKIVVNPKGGFYICNLTAFPFPAGTAGVYMVDTIGNVTPYATGLTTLVDMVLDENTGDLYVQQFGSYGFVSGSTLGFIPQSSKILRIKPGGKQIDSIAGGFGPGAGLAIDRKGNLFVTSMFTGQLFKQKCVATKAFFCETFDTGIPNSWMNTKTTGKGWTYCDAGCYQTNSPKNSYTYLYDNHLNSNFSNTINSGSAHLVMDADKNLQSALTTPAINCSDKKKVFLEFYSSYVGSINILVHRLR